jgi:hypothetical protein
MKKIQEPRVTNVKLDGAIDDKVTVISKRLGLHKSEILRRAIAEGLKTFSDAKLPGGHWEGRDDS